MSDVTVVGSGVAGASVAFAAARAGATVTLIDDARTGRATAAGAGIIAPWATALEGDVYRLYAAGAEAYPEVLAALAEVGIDDVGHATNGALVIGPDGGPDQVKADRLVMRCAASQVAGTPQRVDAAAARAMFPPLADGWEGWFVPGGARIDGRRLAAGLVDGVGRLGGSVRAGTVDIGPGTVTVDGTSIDADTVVVAGGAWTNELLRARRQQVGVTAQRGQICHLGLTGVDTGRWPSVLPPADHYIVPFGDGRIVVGATREDGVADPRVTADGVRRVLDRALDLAPGLVDASLIETRVGLRPFPTDSHRPTIGQIDDATWIVTGFGAIGLTIGPTVGFRVAAMIDGGDDDVLGPFAPGRSPGRASSM
ncbi:MAG: FAD-dependent oxidoreductase [Ilumatobacteraceae bacterium]|nr:FAD-dependent oxidoreductase [Ilumatobacteraceae bacterium]